MNSCEDEADLGAAVVVAIAAWLWCRTHVGGAGANANANMFVGNESKATTVLKLNAAIRIAEKVLIIIAVLIWKTLEGRID